MSAAAISLSFGLVGISSAYGQSAPSAYTTVYRWDALRRITGAISPDPDGAGPIGFPAVRYTYDSDGNLAKTETGVLSAWQFDTVDPAGWTGFTIKTVRAVTLDAAGNQIQEKVTGGTGETLSLTQTAYDADDQAICSAVRMNLSTTATDACALGTVGSFGADRITVTHYDGDGKVDTVKRGAGTADEQLYAQYGYTANGNKYTETDANGNLTVYDYDGFDRLLRVAYPSLTTGSGAVNNADFEYFGYDADSNRTSYRRRNGQTYTYAYDAGNRQTLKTRPDNANLNVASSYDLLGHLIKAQFADNSGTVSYAYDAAGRTLSTTDMFGKTISYQYDQGSLRTALVFPNGTQQVYQYNGANQLTWTGTQDSTVGLGIAYDSLDRPSAITRANGANSTIGLDNADRTTSLGHSFANAGRSVTWAFSYNPASQIINTTTTNTVFDPVETKRTTDNRTYNGLNQDAGIAALGNNTCTAAGAGYDCNGNLTNDGSRQFAYDVDNHLISLSGSTSATYRYDPVGRLAQTTSGGTVTRFMYDGVNLVSEYDGTTNNVLRRYMHTLGTDQPWVQFTGGALTASAAKYLYANYQGSIIALADSSGTVADADIYKYGPYGEPLDINNNLSFSGSRFRYTGQTVMPEAKLYYYKARVYDPVLGRFLQTDPVGSEDDLDLYAYTAGDPVNSSDPSGEWHVECIVTVSNAAHEYIGHVCVQGADNDPVGTTIIVHVNDEDGNKVGKDARDWYVGKWDKEDAFDQLTGDVNQARSYQNDNGGDNDWNNANLAGAPGGGKNAQKYNEQRRQQAADRVDGAREKLNQLKSKPNKTPDDKEDIKKAERELTKALDDYKKSENHSMKPKK